LGDRVPPSIAQGQFNANQIRFLKAVQNVFLKKRQLEFRICMRHCWISLEKMLWNAGLLRSGWVDWVYWRVSSL